YSPLMQAMETRGRLIEFAGGRLLFTYDDRGNLEQISLVGPNGEPDGDQLGVARVVARYDDLGNRSELATFDSNDRPHAINGIARTNWSYDAFGNMTQIASYNSAGKPVESAYGVARQTRRFDERANLVFEAFFDRDGQPTEGVFGYASARFTYDANDNLESSQYLDDQGNPVKTCVMWLYASERRRGRPASTDPASQLQAGDIILSYDGEELSCARIFSQRKRQESMTGAMKVLRVRRGDKVLTLQIPAGTLRRDDFLDSPLGPRARRMNVPGAPDFLSLTQTRALDHLKIIRP
ncbi:MAG: hypothetical protein ACKO23_03565, partial [Gemmataceae bacterium]